MKELNDGGPAFPRPASEYEPNGIRSDGKIAAVPYNGMSLRDWFAGQALSALVRDHGDNVRTSSEGAASSAYSYADAMLKEREVKP